MTALKAAFVYSDVLSRHILSPEHPMKPVRLRYVYELLQSYDAFAAANAALVDPRQATEEEVLGFHVREYVEAVRSFSLGQLPAYPSTFNLGAGDNPIYEGMYEAALWSSGASLRGAELLISGEVEAAMSISGGLHHAMADRASGFCVFNDPVLAVQALAKQGMRVAYVDIDCHHGDGVQAAFYDTDEVLTISVHESGAFIFPGTGFPQETGTGRGWGYSVNVPLYPYTTDDTYLWAFRETVLPLLDAFRPDALVTQIGIDSHYLDPITHLALTVQGFGEAVAEFQGRAPRWLALGGGGYDLQGVARAWTLAFGVLSEQQIPDQVPPSYRETYGVSALRDAEEPPVRQSMRDDARKFAERSVLEIQRAVFPTHGLRAS